MLVILILGAFYFEFREIQLKKVDRDQMSLKDDVNRKLN